MSLKGSFQSISRPALDLRFAQVKRLDPRVTFSRASTGTYFDDRELLRSALAGVARFDHNPTTGESLGLLVEEARTNRQTYSAVSTVGWELIDGGTTEPSLSFAPDGTFYTSTRVTASTLNSGASKTFTAVSGTHIGTFYARSRTGLEQSVKLAFSGITGPTRVLPASGAWTRVTGQTESLAAGSQYVAVLAATSSAIDIDVWGLQAEVGFFPTSYIPTPATFTGRASIATYYDANGIIQTAASGVARSNAFLLDAGGVMRPAGLLLEGAATNDHLVSNQFSNNGLGGSSPKWDVFTRVTLEENQYPDPAGGNTATRVIPTTDLGTHVIGRYSTYGTVPYAHSIFVKPQGYNILDIDANGSTIRANLISRTFSGGSNIVRGLAIQKLPSGWYRVSWLWNNTGGGGANSSQPRITIVSDDGATSFEGDGIKGIDLYGFQREIGFVATSYIPTTTATVTRAADTSTSATVTRSADVAQITGTNFSSWYNYSASTIVIDGKPLATSQNFRLVTAAGGGGENRLWTMSRDFYTQSYAPGGGGMLLTSYPISANFQRYAYSFDYNNSTNITTLKNTTLGQAVLSKSQSGSNIISSGANLNLGGAQDSAGSKLIKRLTYWPMRLPDATLQALTR
jgi:hypothetical protein